MDKQRAAFTAAAIGDGLLKILVGGGAIGLVILAPNSLKMLDKPLRLYLEKMDSKAREREIKRGMYYLRRNGWIDAKEDGYEHGLKITAVGRSHIRASELKNLEVPRPAHWDGKWRLVFYDIPEKYKVGRDALIRQLKRLNFYQLQRSVLVHPFSCREEVKAIASAYSIEDHVSYIETDHIDREDLLIKRFPFLDN